MERLIVYNLDEDFEGVDLKVCISDFVPEGHYLLMKNLWLRFLSLSWYRCDIFLEDGGWDRVLDPCIILRHITT